MPLASFVSQAKARRQPWRMIHHLQIHLQPLTRRCQMKETTSWICSITYFYMLVSTSFTYGLLPCLICWHVLYNRITQPLLICRPVPQLLYLNSKWVALYLRARNNYLRLQRCQETRKELVEALQKFRSERQEAYKAYSDQVQTVQTWCCVGLIGFHSLNGQQEAIRSPGRSWLHGFHFVSSCSHDYSIASIR